MRAGDKSSHQIVPSPTPYSVQAEGITWAVISYEFGAAGCANSDTESVAKDGLAVAVLASIPEVTAVGVTEYWRLTNGPTGGRVLSYIPEIAWNDTAIATHLNGTGRGVCICFTRNF
jgi:hypothetical protein